MRFGSKKAKPFPAKKPVAKGKAPAKGAKKGKPFGGKQAPPFKKGGPVNTAIDRMTGPPQMQPPMGGEAEPDATDPNEAMERENGEA